MGSWSDVKHKHETWNEWAERKYTFETDEYTSKVVESGMVNFSELYTACKIIRKDTGESYIYCRVTLIHRSMNIGCGDHNIMIKELDETVGPTAINCPPKVFKKLTAIEDMPNNVPNDGMVGWRKRVIEGYDVVKRIKKLKVGDTVIFDNDIHFGSYRENQFKLHNKQKGWYKPANKMIGIYPLVRLSKGTFKSRGWAIV